MIDNVPPDILHCAVMFPVDDTLCPLMVPNGVVMFPLYDSTFPYVDTFPIYDVMFPKVDAMSPTVANVFAK